MSKALHLVFLLEEPSAKSVLDGLLLRMLPKGKGISFETIAHRGKSDLCKSIPHKLQAWQTPNTRFIVLHDQDNHDCRLLKQDLSKLCQQAGRDDVLIRIVCRELEAWYFGDLSALEQVFQVKKLQALARKQKYRIPDNIDKPANELEKLIKGFQKGLAARNMPQYMDIEHNNSVSFQQFVQGVQQLCGNLT